MFVDHRQPSSSRSHSFSFLPANVARSPNARSGAEVAVILARNPFRLVSVSGPEDVASSASSVEVGEWRDRSESRTLVVNCCRRCGERDGERDEAVAAGGANRKDGESGIGSIVEERELGWLGWVRFEWGVGGVGIGGLNQGCRKLMPESLQPKCAGPHIRKVLEPQSTVDDKQRSRNKSTDL